MSVAYFIVAEREVEGLDTFVNGKHLAHCQCLGGLADQAGVRPLLDYFSMSPDDAASLFDSDDEGEGEGEIEPPAAFPPVDWFDAAEGLATVRGLIARVQAGPIDLPDDPIPEGLAGFDDLAASLPSPRPEEIIEDLREYESVLSRLASEGVRWHLAIDL